MRIELTPKPKRAVLKTWHWFLLSTMLTFGVLAALPATAQDTAPKIDPVANVVAIDASQSPAVATVFSTVDGSGARIQLDDDDRASKPASTSTADGVPTEIVYVIDANTRSARGDAFVTIKESVKNSVSQLPESVAVGVIAAGDAPIVVSEVTTDRNQVLSAIDTVSFRQRSDIYGSIVRGTELFSSEPGTVRSIVTIATGPDTEQKVPASSSKAALVRTGTQLVALQYNGGDIELAPTSSTSGGVSANIDSIAAIERTISSASSAAAERLMIPFETTGETGTRSNATLKVGDAEQSFSFVNGQNSTRISQIDAPFETAGGAGFFSGVIVLGGLVLLAFVGIGLAVWAVSSMFVGERQLDTLLDRYEANDPTLSEDETQEAVVQTAVVQRAIQLSENFAERQGFLTRMEKTLERADLPIRPGEAVVFFLVGVLVAFTLGLFLTGSIIGAVILALVVAGLSYFALQFMANRRLKKFEAQLPDTLQLLAGTLRAGFSLPQGIDAVSKEIAPPMGSELRRAVSEAQLGRDLEESLEGISERVDSPDFAWAVMAIGIQREVGGNLNELLMTVAETMIARERLRREVNALTAEGRMSALILGLLPPGLGTVLGLGNPEYISVLFTRTAGNILLGLAVLSALIGLAWMKKVITLNV